MFVGHYAVGFALKRALPNVSLGTLLLSVQLLDLVWPVFLLLGWERVRIAPGATAVQPVAFDHYPLSHSLAAAIVWAGAFGLVYYAFRRKGRAAVILALGVLSHWFLDLLVHRPDLPLTPGGPPNVKFGLGLWQSIPATIALEGAMYVAGVAIYLRTTRAKDDIGRVGLWVLVVLLAGGWVQGIFGPPPKSERQIAVGAMLLWLVVPWGGWVDRHRRVR